jgi:hypothetical protein
MIDNNQKTSLLVSTQLPEYIRDDPAYANFRLFLKAYYEWMEQNNNVTDRTKNLLNYKNIDKTPDEFVDYFYNDFLSYFPKDILADKVKVTKIAKELYRSKGTPASYEFLFRVLYDSPVEFFFTKDAVLRASDGVWFISKNLNVATDDPNFLNIKNYSVFGETSKAIAAIENSVFDGIKTQIFISNIRRDFNSGEYVRILDASNEVVLVNGLPLRAKIVGQVNRIDINPENKGLLYRPGDPVGISGGLNSPSGHGASAVVYSTTKGSLQNVRVAAGGFGYRSNPNTLISISGSSGAIVTVFSLNPDPRKTANVTLIPNDTIQNQSVVKLNANNYNFVANITANLTCSLANAFNFLSFTTFPISAVTLDYAGVGLSAAPTILASSLFPTDNAAIIGNIKNLGILAPIQIINAGVNYQANDIIVLTGGSGAGAHANIISVNANGSIIAVDYTYTNPNLAIQFYPLGGTNYQSTSVPAVSIISSNVAAANAVLTVPGILGDGATFSSSFDRVGSISAIEVTDAGADYVEVPTISLKIQDLCVNNVFISNLPVAGDKIFQGSTLASATYFATVDSISPLFNLANTAQSMYRVRVLNYNTTPDITKQLNVENKNIHINLTNQYNAYNVSSRFDSTGVITYGDGTAQANAIFVDGLVSGTGQYVGTRGQLSSFNVLQSQNYNNYTYQITLEQEITKYREILLNLLHPTGTKVLGRFVMSTKDDDIFTEDSVTNQGHTLGYYTGNLSSSVTMEANFTNTSNNIVKFNSLAAANLANIVLSNSTLVMTTSYGYVIKSEVANVVFGSANTVTLKDNVWLSYANVAYVEANSGSNVINITILTDTYDIINNGNYTDPNNPLADILHVGDKVLIANNTEKTITTIDYEAGVVHVDTNFANNSISFMSVKRTFSTTNVLIFGPLGTQYYPEIIDEYGNTITTQNGQLILLG